MSDVFRKVYAPLSESQKRNIAEIKECASKLHELYECYLSSREMEIAKNELESSVMWAVKHITKNG